MSVPNPPLAVTDADRDAALDFIGWLASTLQLEGDTPASFRDRVIQVFARHRLSSTPSNTQGALEAAAIDMVLYCPQCGVQHIDDEEHALVWTGGAVSEPSHDEVTWENPPHRSHLCHGCGCIWRPADVATNGVAAITTTGKADTWTGSTTTPTEVKAAFTFAYARGFQIADETSRSCIGSIDDAWQEYAALKSGEAGL